MSVCRVKQTTMLITTLYTSQSTVLLPISLKETPITDSSHGADPQKDFPQMESANLQNLSFNDHLANFLLYSRSRGIKETPTANIVQYCKSSWLHWQETGHPQCGKLKRRRGEASSSSLPVFLYLSASNYSGRVWQGGNNHSLGLCLNFLTTFPVRPGVKLLYY